MAESVRSRLQRLGITLPSAPPPAANYVPLVKSGDLLFVAGQLPLANGQPTVIGKLGDDVTLERGREAARQCALNVVAQVDLYLHGNLELVVRCVRVGGFVNSAPDFTDQSQVINGASDLIADIFGDIGRHARTAVGVAALPRNAAVEVEPIFQVTTRA